MTSQVIKPEIHILNGPNLNVLKDRPPPYETEEMQAFMDSLEMEWHDRVLLYHYQSNHTGDLIDRIHWIHRRQAAQGVVINPAGLTHTSISLADALEMLRMPIVEVHLTNIYAREAYRHHSFFTSKVNVLICGAGLQGYRWALEWLWQQIQ